MFSEMKFSISKGLFTLLFIVLCIWFISTKVDALSIIKGISSIDLLWISSLTLITLFLLSLQFLVLIRVFSVHLCFKEWFGLTVINTMANYFMPAKTGSIIRGLYLKSKHALPLTHYASLIIVSQLVSFAVVSIIAVSCLKMSSEHDGLTLNILMLGFLFFTLLLITLKFLGKKWLPRKYLPERVINLITLLTDGFGVLSKSKSALFRYCMLATLLLIVWTVRLDICFSAVGIDASFEKILLIQVIVNISFLFSITPGNIGVKEGAVAFAATQVGIDPSLAVLASLIERIIAMMVVFIVGLVCTRELMQESSAS